MTATPTEITRDRGPLISAIRDDPQSFECAQALAVHECAHLCAIVALYGPEAVRFIELVSYDEGFSLNGRNRIRRPPVAVRADGSDISGEALISLSGEAGEAAILGRVTNDSPHDQRSARAISAGLVLAQIPHASFEEIGAKEAGGFGRLLQTVHPVDRPRFRREAQAVLASLEAAAYQFVRLNRDWIALAAHRLLETTYLDSEAIIALAAQKPVLWLSGKPVPAIGFAPLRWDSPVGGGS